MYSRTQQNCKQANKITKIKFCKGKFTVKYQSILGNCISTTLINTVNNTQVINHLIIIMSNFTEYSKLQFHNTWLNRGTPYQLSSQIHDQKKKKKNIYKHFSLGFGGGVIRWQKWSSSIEVTDNA